jgi:hypothetical protein
MQLTFGYYTLLDHDSVVYPVSENEKKMTPLVLRCARETWKLHGIPTKRVSDQEPRLKSKFWVAFRTPMGVKPWMSTAFLIETDS